MIKKLLISLFICGIAIAQDSTVLELPIIGYSDVDTTDILYIIHDPNGSATDRKVERDALVRNWVGSTAITTLGTITTGVWHGTVVALAYGGLGTSLSAYNGLLKVSGGSASQITDNSSNWNKAYTWIGNLVALSGMDANSTDFGSIFTGSTIGDDSNLVDALQDLETAIEYAASGNIDGNDTAYDANTWNGDVNAPSKNTVRDKIETVLAGLLTIGTHLSISGTTLDVNNTEADNWNSAYAALDAASHLVTLSGVAEDSNNLGTFTGSTITDSRTIKQALQDLETAVETESGTVYYYYTANITDPCNQYGSDTQFLIEPKLPSGIEVIRVDVTCNANPATEVNWDLKYANAFIGLAGAAVIADVNTTDGAAAVTSFTDATVDADKCLYLEWAAVPDSALTQISVKIKYIATNPVYEYYAVNIVEPNEVFNNDTQICLDPSVAANRTIEEVYVVCDADPTAEPNMTLKFADAFIGLASATVVCQIDTTAGTQTINSGWTDNTVPAGKAIYLEFNQSVDADLKQIFVRVKWSND